MSDLTIAQFLPYAPREVGDETIQTINAEHVYTYVGMKSAYRHWITRAIKNYGFEEGRDFVAVKKDRVINQQHTTGTGDPIEYHVTFDMAKELTMLARSAKGKEARRYFIEEEKKLRHVERLPQGHLPQLHDPVCCECEQRMLSYDMTVASCQESKLCLACVTQYYEAATQAQRDSGKWLPDTGWKRWKTLARVVVPRSKALYEQARIGSAQAEQAESEAYDARYAAGMLRQHERDALRDTRVPLPNGTTMSGLAAYQRQQRLRSGRGSVESVVVHG